MSGWGFQVPGDLALNAHGTDFVLAAGIHATLQEIRNGATVFLGEWEYDVTAGIPYFQSVFVKPGDTGVIRSVFTRWLLARTGVSEVLLCEVTIEPEIRSAFVVFKVKATDGQVLSDRLPFVLVPRT